MKILVVVVLSYLNCLIFCPSLPPFVLKIWITNVLTIIIETPQIYVTILTGFVISEKALALNASLLHDVFTSITKINEIACQARRTQPFNQASQKTTVFDLDFFITKPIRKTLTM